MKLTRERALELHRQMWTDMQCDLGDMPNSVQRINYKREWCLAHFPHEQIENNCFLCEYDKSSGRDNCESCPIRWAYEDDCTVCYCTNYGYCYRAPISEILALPERKISEDN